MAATDSEQKADAFFARWIDEMGMVLKRQQNRFIVAAKTHIASNYADMNLSLASVAQAVGATPSHLSRLFINTLGIHFTDYLNEYRINQSMQMLSNNDVSIKDVAQACGFSSPQNFNRVFKKRTEKTPGEYRDERAHP